MFKPVEINRLGECLLIHTLSNAYYAMTKSPIVYQTKKIINAQSDLTFITLESGIHRIITTFGLYYDPDKLQNMFFYYVHMA